MTDYPCKVKLCGLRTEADVRAAVELGADAAGFVLSESPRRVRPDEAARLRRLLPETVSGHAVFGPDDPETVAREFRASGLGVAQVHGPDDEAYWEALAGLPFLRAFRVRGPETLEEIRRFVARFRHETFLLDAYVPGVPGGTGESFDWSLARQASRYGRVILAGGLTPANVGEAVAAAQPYMVDVSGGIESSRGVKDHSLMRQFVAAARAARA